MRVRRSDTVILDRVQKTPEGYLDTEGNLTRTGVFTYTRDDGTQQLELRLPEHVFDAASLASFDGVPLTLGHPSRNLDASSVKEHSVGIVMAPHRGPDDHVRARIRVMDKTAVDAVERGLKELSNGYEADLVPVPGGIFRRDDYNSGQPVEAHYLQTNIRGNHTALVAKGRAGPTARLDSAGHQDEREDVEKDDLIKQLQDELSTFRLAREDDVKLRADEAERLRGENEQLKLELKQRQDAEQLAALHTLASRVAPVAKSDASELAKLGEDGIMRAALNALSPELKLDGWSSAMLRGAFEAAMFVEARRTDSAAALAVAVSGTRASEVDTIEENASQLAYQKMKQDAAEAWQKPLGPQGKAR